MHPHLRNCAGQTALELAQNELSKITLPEEKHEKLAAIIEQLTMAETEDFTKKRRAIEPVAETPPRKQRRTGQMSIESLLKPTAVPASAAASAADIAIEPKLDITQLFFSIASGNLALVQQICTSVDPQILFARCNPYGQNILHFAAQYGQNDILEFLVTQPGCGVDIQDHLGLTPLHLCCLDFSTKSTYFACIKTLAHIL